MKKIAALLFLSLTMTAANAIKYHTGIGVRSGKFNSGITFKHFYDADNRQGVQLDAYYTDIPQGGYTVKGLYILQNHIKMPILQIPLDFIYGGGLHVGYFPYHPDVIDPGYYKKVNGKKVPYGKSVPVAGIDGSVQIEYKIPAKRFPFTLTIDANPYYEFLNRGPEWLDFGLSIRYVFR
jgi:hypothetical protein